MSLDLEGVSLRALALILPVLCEERAASAKLAYFTYRPEDIRLTYFKKSINYMSANCCEKTVKHFVRFFLTA